MALFKFRLGAMQELQRHGFDVFAIAPIDSYSKKIEKAGISFIPLRLKSNQISLLDEVLFAYRLFRIYSKIKPNIAFHYTVKINTIGNLIASLIKGTKIISIIPGRGFTFNEKNWLFRAVKFLYKLSLKKSEEVWFLNNEDRNYFIEQKLVGKEKTIVLPGEGVNTSYYVPKKIEPNKLSPTTFILSGRLLWEKGVGEFVDAARIVKKKYPQTQFHLLGFLDDKDKRVVPSKTVYQWVSEGIVSFMGVTDDVRMFFLRADCFVLPSYYGEGLPRTILEAASMGIPVITTDHRGCRRAVDHGLNGFLCEPRNPQDLAEKMLKFIELPIHHKKEMGNNGRKKILEHFDETILKNYYLDKTLFFTNNKIAITRNKKVENTTTKESLLNND